MKYVYFRCENGYVGITDESPAGMKGFVFAGRGPRPGKGIESVCEQGYARNQLDKLEKVKSDDVPNEWFAAIGLEKRLPKPKPISVPESEDVMYLTIELPGDRLRKKMLAKRGTPAYYRWKKEEVQFWVLLAICAVVSWYLTFHVWKF